MIDQRVATRDMSPVKQLEKAMADFLEWMKTQNKPSIRRKRYEKILSEFLVFVDNRKILWDDIFTLKTLIDFRKFCWLPEAGKAVRVLSTYLFHLHRIKQPIIMPNCQIDLPEVYEAYLIYHQRRRQVPHVQIKCSRRVLAAFDAYLNKIKLDLSNVAIEQIDAFLAYYNTFYSPAAGNDVRFRLRSFLSYLYHERKMLKRDLAPLVVGPPIFKRSKPPRFLRPAEVKKLFSSLEPSSPRNIRAYAMVHLAYYLGLRPQEIRLISLDDISFARGELGLPERKTDLAATLPLPEEVIKAVAAYLVGGRPKSECRTLFLRLQHPHGPLSRGVAGREISRCMKKAGLSASAYWLRHTYAQNLLEAGVSLFEIKEMLGHQDIDSTKRYLHIHVKLMREVLFDESL